MIVVNQLELPMTEGVHQVILGKQDAEMLRALALAWNSRTLVSRTRLAPRGQDEDLYRYCEQDVQRDLQETLAANRLTALWVAGPERLRYPESPEVKIEPDTVPQPFSAMYRRESILFRIQALAVPMATWDGSTWVPYGAGAWS